MTTRTRRSQSGTVRIHPYIPDGVTDQQGNDRCLQCRLPRNNRTHGLPERTDDEKAAEARRTGEK